ncbi:hypothetical protein [Streptomyces griseoluteus]|uniref:hypothetical protein n=1 Tax=Streptomyces griseoluteus TaxID=29306 RepID=UPI0037F2BB1E
MLQQSCTHALPEHPLRRKARLKIVVVGVIVVGASAIFSPEAVSAVASAVSASAAVAVAIRNTTETMPKLS